MLPPVLSVKPLASFGDDPVLLNEIVFVPNPSGAAGASSYTFNDTVPDVGMSAGSAVLCAFNVSVTVSTPEPVLVPLPHV